jgi:hypothetical protein
VSTQNTVTTEIVKVTPDMAREWLENNKINRRIRTQNVLKYSRDMQAGRWLLNGDAIRFDANGGVLDGQHRLLAISRAGIPVETLVIRGLAPEVQETIDIGAVRTIADALQLRGQASSTTLAAIGRFVVVYDRSLIGQVGTKPTNAEIIAYISATPTMSRAVDVASKARVLPVTPSAVAAAFHICARIDADAAEQFYINQLIDCMGLTDGDMALALLRRYQRESSGGKRMDKTDVFRYAIYAWNYFRKGRRMTKLQAPIGGFTTSNAPIAK